MNKRDPKKASLVEHLKLNGIHHVNTRTKKKKMITPIDAGKAFSNPTFLHE